MTWLLTLVLLTAILSWVITHKYQEDNMELKKEHKKEVKYLRGKIVKLNKQLKKD